MLRKRAERILKENIDAGVDLVWMSGGTGYITGVTINENYEGGEFSDGSRRYGRTAAATTKEGFYLGQVATVMDREMLTEGEVSGLVPGSRVTPPSLVKHQIQNTMVPLHKHHVR